MLKTRVIPCMLFNGINLVKTIKFDGLRNLGNPIQMARVYNSRNVDELIFIDLKATEEHRPPAFEIVQGIAKECFMPLTIGGGIHSLDDIGMLLKIGADKIAVNSEALQNPEFVALAARTFGSQCVVLSMDAKKVGNDYVVFKNRGLENSGISAVHWAREMECRGAGEILLTSIDKDGTMEGYDLDLIKAVAGAVSVPVIASGGAGKVQDIIDAVLVGHADAVSLASMFHYSGHTANSIKQRMWDAGIPVRMV
ncbi:MAG: imidazole glycerol phosphate synthase cyclase subunit [bacterium]|nr:imidazole glycerol phosphate synthase cyclase subunit [bacterium]